MYRNIGETPT
jgi:hypothetical protein